MAQARSWVPGADGSGFGLDNLPLGVITTPGAPPRPATRIGDFALPLHDRGLDLPLPDGVLDAPVLNPLLALGRPAWSALRARLTDLLAAGAPERPLVPLADAEALLPIAVGDYVDFYSSLEHASN